MARRPQRQTVGCRGKVISARTDDRLPVCLGRQAACLLKKRVPQARLAAWLPSQTKLPDFLQRSSVFRHARIDLIRPRIDSAFEIVNVGETALL